MLLEQVPIYMQKTEHEQLPSRIYKNVLNVHSRTTCTNTHLNVETLEENIRINPNDFELDKGFLL